MPGWVLQPSQVTVRPASDFTALYSNNSPKLLLNPQFAAAANTSQPANDAQQGGEDEADNATLSLRLAESKVLLQQTPSKQPPLTIDCVLYTGGVIWSSAFCPLGQPAGNSSTPPTNLPTPEPDPAPEPPPAKRAKKGKETGKPSATTATTATTTQPAIPASTQSPEPSTGSDRWPAGARVWRGCGDPWKRTELLAVAVHPAGAERNTINQKLSGPGAVQLWAVPGSTDSVVCPSGSPRCVYALLHQGRLAWDVQSTTTADKHMQPPPAAGSSKSKSAAAAAAAAAAASTSPALATTEPRVMGVLALALGDGSVQVVVVPDPTDSWLEQQLYNEAGAEGAAPGGVQPAAVELQPEVVITAEQLNGSVASSLAWRPHKPHLLVACWDGSISCWQLPGPRTHPLARLTPLFLTRSDGLAIRRVLWHPPRTDTDTDAPTDADLALALGADGQEVAPGPRGANLLTGVDDLDQHLFVSFHQGGHVRAWDDRDFTRPVFEKLLSRSALYDGVWVFARDRMCMVGVFNDGCVRQLELYPPHHLDDHKCNAITVMSGSDPACLWAISYSPELGVAAMAGEEGIVALSHCDTAGDHRNRKPHVPVGGIVSDRGMLRVCGPRELAGIPCVFRGSLQAKLGGGGNRGGSKALLPTSEVRDSVQTLYSVCWSPNVARTQEPGRANAATWLAFGGLAGFVRCMRVAADR